MVANGNPAVQMVQPLIIASQSRVVSTLTVDKVPVLQTKDLNKRRGWVRRLENRHRPIDHGVMSDRKWKVDKPFLARRGNESEVISPGEILSEGPTGPPGEVRMWRDNDRENLVGYQVKEADLESCAHCLDDAG
jgi:hypothetical protein